MNDLVLADLVQFLHSTLPPRYQCALHLHHFFQLDVVLAGRVKLIAEGRPPFRAAAGDAWLIPPLLRHGYESRDGYRIGIFKFHLMPRFLAVFNAGYQRFRAPAAWLAAVEAAGVWQARQMPCAPQRASAVLTLGLMETLKTAHPSGSRPDEMDPFRRNLWSLLEKILQEPRQTWSVRVMARECRLSPGRFTRCFRAVVGMTPCRYLLEMRMKAAATDLLADPLMPIKAIAEKANYTTVHAFTRAFKQIFSVSPGAYRHWSEIVEQRPK